MQTSPARDLGIEFPTVTSSHRRDVVPAATRAGGLGVLGDPGAGSDG